MVCSDPTGLKRHIGYDQAGLLIHAPRHKTMAVHAATTIETIGDSSDLTLRALSAASMTDWLTTPSSFSW
jgi:hypothetical protein